jgi:outer membrane protein insertion porin family
VYRGKTIKPVVLDFVAEGEQADLGLYLGDVSLARGSGQMESPFPFSFEIDLSALPITPVVQGWTGVESKVDVGGTLHFDVPLRHPEELTYRAVVDRYEATFPNWSHRSSSFTVEGDLTSFSVQGLQLTGGDRRLDVEGVVPLTKGRRFDLNVAGELAFNLLDELIEDLRVTGQGRADLTVRGTWENPNLVGEVQLGEISGDWKGLSWDNVQLQARADGERLRLTRAGGNILGGEFTLNGEFPLALDDVNTPGRLEFVLEGLDFGQLIDEDLGDLPKPSLVVSTHGAVDISALSLDGLRGSGEVTKVALKVGDSEVRNLRSAPWKLEDSSFSIPELRLEGASTDIVMSLGPVRFGEAVDWRGSIRGTLDNGLLNAYLRLSGMEMTGSSSLDFEMSDGPDGFVIDGRGELLGGRFVFPDPPLLLSELRGTLTIDKSLVQVTGVSARVGGGRLSGESTIDLSVPAKPKIDFRAEADGVRLQFAEGVRGQVSGTVRFQGQESYLLSGNLILNQGFFNREIDEDDRLMGSSLRLPGDTSVEKGFRERVSLDLSIQTEQSVRVDMKQAQLEATGNLTLAGTLDSPEIAGNLAVRPDGTFTVGRNRFQITTGRLEFQEFPVSSPRIMLSAITRVGSTIIQLDLEGEIDDLHTRLSAPDDPNLTEGDLASLLVTGRTLENAGEGGQQIASTWAMSSLANLLNEGWGDVFTFGPPPGSGPLILEDEENPTSRLTLGRSITKRLSIMYSIALDRTDDQLWVLDYQVARNVWLRSMQRRGNEYSLGFSHRFEIDTKKASSRAKAEQEQQKLSRIMVSGDYPGTEAEWLKMVRAKVGTPRDYWAALEDAQRIQNELIERGFLSAFVDVDKETTEDDTTLVFRIQAGPPLEIVWEGDDPGGDMKKKIEGAWNGRIPESYLVSDLALRATRELRAQRYYSARVEGRVEENAESRSVVFTTVRGPRGAGVRLEFLGNEAVDDVDLTKALPATTTPEFFVLLDKPTEMEKGIRLLYTSRGYLDASLGTVETRYDAPSKTLNVVIPLDEGPLWKLVTIRFEGTEAITPEELHATIGLDEGQPFSLPQVKDAQVKIKSVYRERGFPDVAVNGELEEAPGGVSVTYSIEEGALAEVGNIRIVGTTRTRESVIRRQLTFREGDAVRLSELRKSQRYLYDTRVFSSVDVRVDSGQEGKKQKDILVQVAERTDLDVSYGLRYNLVTQQDATSIDTQPEGLEGVVRAALFNPFGRGATLSLSAFVQTKRTLFRATERFPHFFRFRLPTELIFEFEREQGDVGFEYETWSVAFQQTRTWRHQETGRDRFAVQWNVRAGQFSFGCDPGLEGESLPGCNLLPSYAAVEDEFRTTIGASLIEDQRNSLSNPTRGRFWNVTLQFAPKFLGSETQYLRLYGQLFYHYPLTKRLVWASSYRLGVASGSTEFLYIEDRFKAGGANSVRGFKQDSLGPSITLPGADEEFFFGGQSVVVMNQELRFPLYKMLHGGVFYDTGNVFANARDTSLSDLRHTAGAGARLVFSFGVLRFDWARILDLKEGEDPSRFHFSFGYAF